MCNILLPTLLYKIQKEDQQSVTLGDIFLAYMQQKCIYASSLLCELRNPSFKFHALALVTHVS